MKLYTEEQVRKAIMIAENEKIAFTTIVTERLTPIELPSDDEIKEEVLTFWRNVDSVGVVGWFDGAKWMRDKIQGDNK